MASTMSSFSFLRPLGLPRVPTLSRFLSTATTTTTTSTASTASQAIPYRVTRTASQSLPIYHLSKRGGNMKLTKLRKIEGNLSELKTDLQVALGVDEKEVVVNQLTRHIIIKGHKKAEIAKFLEDKKF